MHKQQKQLLWPAPPTLGSQAIAVLWKHGPWQWSPHPGPGRPGVHHAVNWKMCSYVFYIWS